MVMNKKGAEMTISTIILIVLGVLILVFLIIGFSIGWNKIFPYISPPNNVQDIKDKCDYACNVGSKYDFCSSIREVKVESDLTQNGITITSGKKVRATCYDLVGVTQLGFARCPAMACEAYSNEDFAKLACNNAGKQYVAQKDDANNAINIKFYSNGALVDASCR